MLTTGAIFPANVGNRVSVADDAADLVPVNNRSLAGVDEDTLPDGVDHCRTLVDQDEVVGGQHRLHLAF